MKSSVKLLDFLINDILDFAQLRSGKFRMRVTSFDLREAIEEIILIQ
jgi:signal transduction histidine kinase